MPMKYKFSKENLTSILKVFGYSAGSAVVGVAIVMLGDIEFPAQYMFLVTIVNTGLVALKEFLNEKR